MSQMNLRDCNKCQLSAGRGQVVLGSGNQNADLMFIGEAPGKDEDLKGKPFVGVAGKYLDELLVSIGLKRSDVFISNIIKCRPPNNRDPFDDEVEACSEWLLEEIKTVKPKVIITLGRHAAALFIPKIRMSEMHGNIIQIGKLRIFLSYHPAAALYDRGKRQVIEGDFQKLKELL